MSSTDTSSSRTAVLVSIGGLPATGKTTIARCLARRLGAAYVRIDTIEAALARAEGRCRQANDWEMAPGYEVGRDVAVDQLRIDRDVVAESVNPVRASRDAWRDAGLGAGARVVEVEIICSDAAEHRRRAEERVLDVVGLTKPTWEQITNRGYDSWDREHVVVDTAVLGVDDAVHLIHAALSTENTAKKGDETRS